MASAIFSASVAVILFVCTQLWTSVRSRSDRLKQKHEDLIDALFSILHVIQPIPDHLPLQERSAMSLARSFEVINATTRPQVLLQLYFKDAIPRFERFLEALSKVTARFRAGAENPDHACLTKEETSGITSAMTELTQWLLENADTLTKEPSSWIRPSSW
ncbi:MAG: hypothetical protein ACO1TE_22925 [Prosthecobacter sp.]